MKLWTTWTVTLEMVEKEKMQMVKTDPNEEAK
jgi:hypothetical protein